MSEIKVFDYLNAINTGKDMEVIDRVYNQFLINRGLSMHLDTIGIASLANLMSHVDNQMHFDFMRGAVVPKKRWSGKWPKPKHHEDVALLSKYYNISMDKAYDLFKVMKRNTIDEIRKEMTEE